MTRCYLFSWDCSHSLLIDQFNLTYQTNDTCAHLITGKLIIAMYLFAEKGDQLDILLKLQLHGLVLANMYLDRENLFKCKSMMLILYRICFWTSCVAQNQVNGGVIFVYIFLHFECSLSVPFSERKNFYFRVLDLISMIK